LRKGVTGLLIAFSLLSKVVSNRPIRQLNYSTVLLCLYNL